MINKVWVQKTPSTVKVGRFLLCNPRVNVPVEDQCVRIPSERPRVISVHITQGCDCPVLAMQHFVYSNSHTHKQLPHEWLYKESKEAILEYFRACQQVWKAWEEAKATVQDKLQFQSATFGGDVEPEQDSTTQDMSHLRTAAVISMRHKLSCVLIHNYLWTTVFFILYSYCGCLR